AGAALSVADSVSVLIRNSQTITVDAGGALYVGAATVAIEDTVSSIDHGIVVNGAMTANGTSFIRAGGGNSGYCTTYIQVNAGGRPEERRVGKDWNSLVLANDSDHNSGDLSGNTFGVTPTVK